MSCGQRPELLDRDGLMHWILKRLGAPQWKIELHPCQLEMAIDDAIAWYLKWKGARKTKYTDMLSGKVDYDYPDEADTILDVIPPDNPTDLNNLYQTQPYYTQLVPYDGYRESFSAGGPVSSFVQAVQYNETSKRVYSQQFEWMLDPEKRKVIISPAPSTSGLMAIVYKSGCLNIAELSAYDHDLLKRYALAVATGVLGLVRRKFSRIPGADGEQQLDGADLVRESREDLEKLDEDIRESCYPMPIITG